MKEQIKAKEPVNLYRMLSLVAITLDSIGFTFFLCARSRLYLDESLCLLFLDMLFVLIYVFELEYERKNRKLSDNTQTSFVRLAVIYVVCSFLIAGMTFLPEFFRPVMLVVILICAVSNVTIAVSAGIFWDILLTLSTGDSFYALACFVVMTTLGAVLAQGLRRKEYRIWISLLYFFISLIVPGALYYLAYKEVVREVFIYGAVNGVVTAVVAYFVFGWLARSTESEKENRYFDIVSEDFSEVKALKNFSMIEYRHSKKVSDVAYACAKEVGLDEGLCMAAGLYYRMGRWIGEPYNENAVQKAKTLCFPEPLIVILSEYYGQEHRPSTPESALVHMVDALLIKLEAIELDVNRSQWNREMFIYQTLNEFSSSGIYDESGMSMNRFLSVREFLAKKGVLQ
jgi:hypothetical protein